LVKVSLFISEKHNLLQTWFLPFNFCYSRFTFNVVLIKNYGGSFLATRAHGRLCIAI